MGFESVQWMAEHFGLAGLILGLWMLDRYRLEKILDKHYDRYIEILVTVTQTMSKLQTIISERLHRSHDTDNDGIPT
jgi:hypothetical protein